MKYRSADEALSSALPSNPGDVKFAEKALLIDKESGVQMIQETGKIINIQDQIDAARPYTLHDLLDRLDTSAMNDIQLVETDKVYDYTHDVTDLCEMHSILTGVQGQFDALPVEVRNVFDNSLTRFMQCMDNGTAQDMINKAFAPQIPTDNGGDKDNA